MLGYLFIMASSSLPPLLYLFSILLYIFILWFLFLFRFFLFVAHLSSLLTMHNHETFFYFHMCIVHCTGSIVPDNCAHTRTHVHFPHLLLCDSYTLTETITIDFQISFQIDYKWKRMFPICFVRIRFRCRVEVFDQISQCDLWCTTMLWRQQINIDNKCCSMDLLACIQMYGSAFILFMRTSCCISFLHLTLSTCFNNYLLHRITQAKCLHTHTHADIHTYAHLLVDNPVSEHTFEIPYKFSSFRCISL